MTGKLMFVPDTHVVVPKKLSKNMDDVLYDGRDTNISSDELYSALVAAAPQLTTPPVVRWEGNVLKLFDIELAHVFFVYGVWQPSLLVRKNLEHPLFAEGTKDEARSATEKALGLPIVEEV